MRSGKRPWVSGSAFCVLHCVFLLVFCSSCNVLGVGAYALSRPGTVQAAYKDLQNQSVAVMVWSGTGTEIDFPTLRLDVAQGIQQKLLQAQSVGKVEELEGTEFKVLPESVIKYQEDHPEIEWQPATEVVPKLGASRVIYVEIDSFQTRSDLSVELYRGAATAHVRVYAVEGDAASKVYEDVIEVAFPENVPPEGITSTSDEDMYNGTVDQLTTEVATRFIPSPERE